MKNILIIALFLISNIAYTQVIHELRIGEKVPNITLSNFLNETQRDINFSDLKGKLIILDFWNIHCGSCIAAMPRLNTLQKEFGNKIQVIYVTKNTKEEVLKLFSRIKMSIPDIPFIVSDTILNKLFPHNGDPLHVWITPTGNVYGITFDYNTNPTTVKEFLNGKTPLLDRRRDFGVDQNYPLLSEQNATLLSLTERYSALFKGLTEYQSSVSVVIRKDTLTGKAISLTAVNLGLLSLYNLAYENEIFNYDINFFSLPRNNRILLDLKDSSDFFYPKEENKISNWIKKNTLSYEIKIPSVDSVKIYKYMQEDLNRYLPYRAAIEKRVVRCLVLQKDDNTAFKTKIENPVTPSKIEYGSNNSIHFSNVKFSDFVMQLVYANSEISTPIIDDTHIFNNIDMVIGCQLSDIPSLKKELKKYGLTLREENRNVDMLVISDK